MKRYLCALLCAAMLVCLGAPALALPAAGTPEELEKIEGLVQADVLSRLGLFRGKPEGFALDEGVTRAQAVTMLVRFLGAEGEAMLSSVGTPFTDVPQSHWAVAYTTYAKLHGITEGTSETTFSPEDPVTGPQLCKLILAALGYEDLTLQNAYAKGVGAGLLVNSPLKKAVLENKTLVRADLVRFFHAALLAKLPAGGPAYETLIEKGVFTKERFDEVMTAEYNTPSLPVRDQDYPVDFALDLLNALKKDGENVTISPLSVKLALAMAAEGAQGETQAEMLRVLGISDLDAFGKSAAKLIDRGEADKHVTFRIADAIFLNEDAAREAGIGVGFKDSYVKAVRDSYRAEAQSVKRADAVQTVNAWVARQTADKIPSLISSADWLACLVNAIYFYGEWAIKFSPEVTREQVFHAASGAEQTVPMMHMTKFLDYWADGDTQVLRLPYRGGEFSMLIGLGDIDGNLADYADKLENARVAVTLPKFEIEYGQSLKGALQALGMQRAFTEDAELGAMLDGTTARISDVIHKTYLHVTEDGTEAAAATAVMVEATGMIMEPPVQFTADRPFTWCILDETTGEVVFCGVVNTLE